MATRRPDPDSTPIPTIAPPAPGPARPSTTPPARELPKPYQRERGYVLVGSAAAYRAMQSTLPHAKAWKTDEGPHPVAHVVSDSAAGSLQFVPAILDRGDLAPEEREAWALAGQQVGGAVSALDADVLDAVCGLFITKATDRRDSVRIHVDEILDLLDKRKNRSGAGRRGGYKQAQRDSVREAVWRLQSLLLHLHEAEVVETPADGKKQRLVKKPFVGRPFTVWDLDAQIRLDGSLLLVGDWLHIQPHPDVARSLFGRDRQVALQSRQALTMHVLNEATEKALSRYLAQLWRIRAGKETYAEPLRVQTILDKISLVVDPAHPARTKDRLEAALDRILDKGIIAGWQYVDWDEAAAPRKGFVEAWARSSITIEPPDEIRDHYRANLHRPPRRKETTQPAPATPRGDALRAARGRLRVSQAVAAEEAGVSQKTFSRAEAGNPVSAAAARKLDGWLARSTAGGLQTD